MSRLKSLYLATLAMAAMGESSGVPRGWIKENKYTSPELIQDKKREQYIAAGLTRFDLPDENGNTVEIWALNERNAIKKLRKHNDSLTNRK